MNAPVRDVNDGSSICSFQKNLKKETCKLTKNIKHSSSLLFDKSKETTKNTRNLEDSRSSDENFCKMKKPESKIIEKSSKGRFLKYEEELGRGAYKTVYKGADLNTGIEIAWNEIFIDNLDTRDVYRLKEEIHLLKNLNHKNILHCISSWRNNKQNKLVIITELVTTNILKYLKQMGYIKLKVIKNWCISILNALAYLHEYQPYPIIHRDIKCSNIFVNTNNSEIKIGDLGLSTMLTNGDAKSVIGTPEFMAPEIYREHYDTKSDIYAFGMCLLEMITQEKPYLECSNPGNIFYRVINRIHPISLSTVVNIHLKKIIEWCIEFDPKMRPTANQLLKSEFFMNLNDLESNKVVRILNIKSHININTRPHMKVTKNINDLNKNYYSELLNSQESNDDSQNDEHFLSGFIKYSLPPSIRPNSATNRLLSNSQLLTSKKGRFQIISPKRIGIPYRSINERRLISKSVDFKCELFSKKPAKKNSGEIKNSSPVKKIYNEKDQIVSKDIKDNAEYKENDFQNIPVHLLIKNIETEKMIMFTFLLGKDTSASVTEQMIANNIIDSAYKKVILEMFEKMIFNRVNAKQDPISKIELITLNINKILSNENVNIIFSKIASNVEILSGHQEPKVEIHKNILRDLKDIINKYKHLFSRK